MPTIALSKRAADAAAPEVGRDGKPRRTIYFDRALAGFGLLVTEAGAKSFVVKYRAAAAARRRRAG